jgi:murein DD-endopeptidase MepM/ murein hydrolase activator NlpD
METPGGGPQVFDLTVGEEAFVEVENGPPRRLRLLEVMETADRIRGVIRDPAVAVEVDGERAVLPAALYSLPRVINGLKLDCAVTRGVARGIRGYKDAFALDKDARLRCWAPGACLFGGRPMTYPARQRWFASMTQLGNERTYVDAGELPLNDPNRYIYYHFGTDIGGYDKAVPIVAAAPGRIIGLGLESAPDAAPGRQPRADVVLVRDDREWEYAYAHLDMINPDLRVNQRLEAGEFIGFLGQKGSSGGWSHLHFGINAPQPSGRPGQVNAYPFFVEAYLNEYPGALLACARPHRVAGVDEEVVLDASNSICDGGEIRSYRWNLSDGREVSGPRARIRYPVEGMYSERVTVIDDRGRSDVDFCVVQILPEDADPARTPPTMHLTYYPTCGIRPGQPVAFKARTFIRGPFAMNKAGVEEWDFGDGVRAVSCSEENFDERWHAYAAPGRYIVTVKRTAANGRSAVAQLKVIVDE